VRLGPEKKIVDKFGAHGKMKKSVLEMTKMTKADIMKCDQDTLRALNGQVIYRNGSRYYYFSRQGRMFPVKSSLAIQLLANGSELSLWMEKKEVAK